MAKKMGKYCKAYPIERLRQFAGWKENTQNVKKEKSIVDGKEIDIERELTENSFLYVQENFTVTDGIFLDENVIFADVTPEWVEYCKNELKFEIPNYELAKVKEAGAAESAPEG